MPKCSQAYKARISNLPNNQKSGKTTIEDIPPDGVPAMEPWEKPEFLDLIGTLQGTAVIEDEDEEDLEGDSDDEGPVCNEETSALEAFAQTLQQAHNIAEAAARRSANDLSTI